MDVRRLVGLNFERLRREKGFTQEGFAEISGMTQQYVSDLERGKRNPTVLTLHYLASALSVKPADLLVEVDAAAVETPAQPARRKPARP